MTDRSLILAARAVMEGHCHVDLGGGVFKQRVARAGGGKSGGFRTIVLFRMGGQCFFVYGFAKSDQENVSPKELRALKRLAIVLLAYSGSELATATAAGELIEVLDDGGED